MNNLNKIDEKELAKYLEQWFNEVDITKEHFWDRSKVGQIIKKWLKMGGKWKNRARGNPRKGYKKLIENRNIVDF